MMNFTEILTLMVVAVCLILFSVSFWNESIVVSKKVLNKFNDDRKKRQYLFLSRLKLLLYSGVAIGALLFSKLRTFEYITTCVIILALLSGVLNKKYLGYFRIK